jgi:hypothetical protein
MRPFACFALASSAVLFACAASPVLASNSRSFVSIFGDDANSCTTAQPCRTFQHAHDVTQSGGEIEPITAGGYGSVIITKSIKILNGGAGAVSTTAPAGGAAITINAQSTDTIVIEGLQISGLGVGAFGIVFNSGARLTVSNSRFTDFHLGEQPDSGSGILCNGQTSALMTLVVSDSYFVHNDNTGILAEGAQVLNAAVQRSTFVKNAAGIDLIGSGGGRIIVDSSTFTENFTGLLAAGPMNVYLSKSIFMGNTNGLNSTAITQSYGDNRINNNGTDLLSTTLIPLSPR